MHDILVDQEIDELGKTDLTIRDRPKLATPKFGQVRPQQNRESKIFVFLENEIWHKILLKKSSKQAVKSKLVDPRFSSGRTWPMLTFAVSVGSLL